MLLACPPRRGGVFTYHSGRLNTWATHIQCRPGLPVFRPAENAGVGCEKGPLDAVFRVLVLVGRSHDYTAKEFQRSKALLSLRVEEIEKRMKSKRQEGCILYTGAGAAVEWGDETCSQ